MAIDPSILLQAKQIGFNPIDQVRQDKLKQVQEQAAQGQLTLQNQDIQHNQLVAQQQADAQRQEAAFQAAIKVNPDLDDNAVVGLLGSQRGSQFLKAREDSKSSLATRQKNMAEAKAKQTEIDSNYAGGLARTVIESNYDPLVISHVLDLAGQDPDHAQQVQQIRQQLTQGGPDSAKFIFKTLYNTSQTTAQAAAEKASKDRLSIEDSHNKALEANQAATNERLVQGGARQEANDRFNHEIQTKRLSLEQQRVGLEQQQASGVSAPSGASIEKLRAYSEGRLRLPMGKAGDSIAQDIIDHVDPEFDRTKADSRKKTRESFSPQGKAGENLKGLETSGGHLAQLESAAKELSNMNGPEWANNAANLAGRSVSASSDAKQKKFNQVKLALLSDLGGVLGGSKAEAAAHRLLENLSPGAPPETQSAVFGEIRSLLGTRHQALKDQWESEFGTKGYNPMLKKADDVIWQRNGKSAAPSTSSRPSLDSFEK
jgi:hypothetical protein